VGATVQVSDPVPFESLLVLLSETTSLLLHPAIGATKAIPSAAMLCFKNLFLSIKNIFSDLEYRLKANMTTKKNAVN